MRLDMGRTTVVAGSCFVGAILVAVASASWATRHKKRPRLVSSLPATRIIPLMAGVVTSIGIRAALERGSNGRTAPTRSSTIGAAVSVTAIVAVVTFGGALGRLVEQPMRYGYGWDMSVRSADVASMMADPDIVAAAPIWFTLRIRVNGRSVFGWAYDPNRRDPGLVIVDGRLPEKTDEVALGAKTMQAAGVKIGRTVDLEGQTFRVVGQALFPTTHDAFPLADGALVSNEARASLKVELREDEPWVSLVVARLRPRSDQAALFARPGPPGADQPEPVIVPREVNQLRQLGTLPWTLGALLSAIALLGVGLGLSLAVHRRASDRAVLRALGLTSRQASWSVAAQATTLAGIAVAVGVPAGLVLGNRIWFIVARSYGLRDDAVVPLWVAAVVPVTLLLANLLAWRPGRRGANVPVASVLRAE
jgi:hypothetical protein